MQNAKKAWWRNVKIYRNKDVPWRVKCRRMVEHVQSVFCFGSGTWSWSRATLDRIKGWGIMAMRRVFRSTEKKMRRGQTVAAEQQGVPGN